MDKVLHVRDERIGRVTLTRLKVITAIDEELPAQLAAAVSHTDSDPKVGVMALSGDSKGFCSSYVLAHFTTRFGSNKVSIKKYHGTPSKGISSRGPTPSISCHCCALLSR